MSGASFLLCLQLALIKHTHTCTDKLLGFTVCGTTVTDLAATCISCCSQDKHCSSYTNFYDYIFSYLLFLSFKIILSFKLDKNGHYSVPVWCAHTHIHKVTSILTNYLRFKSYKVITVHRYNL